MDQDTQDSRDNSSICKHLFPFFKAEKLPSFPEWMPTPTEYYMQNLFPFFRRLLPWRISVRPIPPPSPTSRGLSGQSTYVIAFFMSTFARSCFYCRERAEQQQNELHRLEKDVQHEKDLEKQDEFEQQWKDAEQRCKSLREELDRREQDAQRGKDAEHRYKTLEEQLDRQKQDIQRGKDAEKRLDELVGLKKDTEHRCKTLEEQLEQNREASTRQKKELDENSFKALLHKVGDMRRHEMDMSKLRSKLQKLQDDLKKLKPTKKFTKLLTQMRLDAEGHTVVVAGWEKIARTKKVAKYQELDSKLTACDPVDSVPMGLIIEKRGVQDFVLTREDDRERIPCVQWKEIGLVSKGIKQALDSLEPAYAMAAQCLTVQGTSTNAIDSRPTGQK